VAPLAANGAAIFPQPALGGPGAPLLWSVLRPVVSLRHRKHSRRTIARNGSPFPGVHLGSTPSKCAPRRPRLSPRYPTPSLAAFFNRCQELATEGGIHHTSGQVDPTPIPRLGRSGRSGCSPPLVAWPATAACPAIPLLQRYLHGRPCIGTGVSGRPALSSLWTRRFILSGRAIVLGRLFPITAPRSLIFLNKD
jgi:hypothetical protein